MNLLQQEQKKQQRQQLDSSEPEQKQDESNQDNEETKSSASSVWGFASFMAKGVKKTIVNVVNKVEEMVDDGVAVFKTRPIAELFPATTIMVRLTRLSLDMIWRAQTLNFSMKSLSRFFMPSSPFLILSKIFSIRSTVSDTFLYESMVNKIPTLATK